MIFFIPILLYYILLIFAAIKFQYYNDSIQLISAHNVSVSVLIPFKDEENNIKNIINNLKTQSYNNNLLQYILINDNSTDNSFKIAKNEIKDDNRFEIIELSNNFGKKQALSKGLELAKHEIIIHTDADVLLNKEWITTIVNFYLKYNFKLALAPVLYKTEKTILEKLQSLEIINLAGLTGGSLLLGIPLMANGANLIYHKSIKHLFIDSINNKSSGDDIFFLEKVIEKYPEEIKYIKHKEAIVYTYPEETLNLLINQRLRWAGKSVKFSNKTILITGIIIIIINIIVLLGFILTFFMNNIIKPYLLFLSFKFITELFTLYIYCNYFNKKSLLYLVPILFIFYPIYTLLIGIGSIFIKPKWKDRIIKN